VKIREILIAGGVAFLALLIVILGLTVRLLSSGGGDAQYINLAGRQRMLSQKLSKEMLVYESKPSQASLESIERTATVFSRTQKALRSGGKAPLRIDNTNETDVGGATDPALTAKLDEVSSHWDALYAAIQKLEAAGVKRQDAITKLSEVNMGLLATMDQATNAFGSRDSSVTINVAGRQRMLSQKIMKEVFLYATTPTAELRQTLQESIILFSRSHKALRFGGETHVGPQVVMLEPSGNGTANAKLEVADRLWKEMEGALNVVLSEGSNPEARAAFLEENTKVLKAADEAVGLAERVSEEKIKTLQNAQFITMGIGLILVAFTIFVASKIGQSIARLQKAAEAISMGEVNHGVAAEGIGELKALSGSFERMRVSLALAMGQLESNDAPQFSGAHPTAQQPGRERMG
jgi:nitrate/nitrite-specific signal transduction histidine kinase